MPDRHPPLARVVISECFVVREEREDGRRRVEARAAIHRDADERRRQALACGARVVKFVLIKTVEIFFERESAVARDEQPLNVRGRDRVCFSLQNTFDEGRERSGVEADTPERGPRRTYSAN